MAQTTTIQLKKPVIGHGAPITQVTVCEPKARDYFSLGEPFVIAKSKDGSWYHVESPDVMAAYIERCVIEPKDPLLLMSQLTLADAMRIKKAISDFFTEAQVDSYSTTATSSSSASAA